MIESLDYSDIRQAIGLVRLLHPSIISQIKRDIKQPNGNYHKLQVFNIMQHPTML